MKYHIKFLDILAAKFLYSSHTFTLRISYQWMALVDILDPTIRDTEICIHPQ